MPPAHYFRFGGEDIWRTPCYRMNFGAAEVEEEMPVKVPFGDPCSGDPLQQWEVTRPSQIKSVAEVKHALSKACRLPPSAIKLLEKVSRTPYQYYSSPW